MTRPFCQGHGQIWVIRCSVCGKEKYPIAIEKPGPEWVCAPCRAGAGSGRRESGRKAGIASRAKKRLQGTQISADGPEAA